MIEIHDLKKSFQLNGERIEALRGVNFSIEQGEILTIVGPSGSIIALSAAREKPLNVLRYE